MQLEAKKLNKFELKKTSTWRQKEPIYFDPTKLKGFQTDRSGAFRPFRSLQGYQALRFCLSSSIKFFNLI